MYKKHYVDEPGAHSQVDEVRFVVHNVGILEVWRHTIGRCTRGHKTGGVRHRPRMIRDEVGQMKKRQRVDNDNENMPDGVGRAMSSMSRLYTKAGQVVCSQTPS